MNTNFENYDVHQLTQLWMIRLIKGEKLTFEDLMPYSLISLKRKRMRKKFLKNPYRYISDKTHQIWLGCLVGNLTGTLFRKSLSLDLEPIEQDPEHPLPKAKIHYLDYQYDNNKQ